MPDKTGKLDRVRRETQRARDAYWCSLVLGIAEILTPEQAKLWLERDRLQRARNVAEASRCHGHPKHY